MYLLTAREQISVNEFNRIRNAYLAIALDADKEIVSKQRVSQSVCLSMPEVRAIRDETLR